MKKNYKTAVILIICATAFVPQSSAFLASVQTAGYAIEQSGSALEALTPVSLRPALPAAAIPGFPVLSEITPDPAERPGVRHEPPEGQTMSFREIQRLLPTARRILHGGD